MMTDEMQKRFDEARATYKRVTLEIFKAAGIPVSEFVEPPEYRPFIVYRVKLVLTDECITNTGVKTGDGMMYQYRFKHKGKYRVSNHGTIEYLCKSLEEAQTSYSPREVSSVSIEEAKTFNLSDISIKEG